MTEERVRELEEIVRRYKLLTFTDILTRGGVYDSVKELNDKIANYESKYGKINKEKV